MRLYKEKIPVIAEDIITTLVKEGDIECEAPAEAQLDAESVLLEYVRMNNEITDLAKQRLQAAKLPYSNLGRIKKGIADEKGFVFGDEGIKYICNQMVELFLQSNNVDEIFSDDYILRGKIEPLLQRHLSLDDTIDAEVRKRIRNLEEGTMSWDIEYREMEKNQIEIRSGVKSEVA